MLIDNEKEIYVDFISKCYCKFYISIFCLSGGSRNELNFSKLCRNDFIIIIIYIIYSKWCIRFIKRRKNIDECYFSISYFRI